MDLFEKLEKVGDSVGVTKVGDLRSEFLTTHACGEEGVPC